jgi:hypothetical protein
MQLRTNDDAKPIEIGHDIEWVAVEAASGRAFPATTGSGDGKQGVRAHTFSHGLRAALVATGSVMVDGRGSTSRRCGTPALSRSATSARSSSTRRAASTSTADFVFGAQAFV